MKLSRHKFHAMGCPCELRLYADAWEIAKFAADACIAEAARFEQKYSRYLEESVTSEINRSAGHRPAPIDPETAAILAYAGVCYELSGGLFDITSGVLRQVWHRDMTGIPKDAELTACLEKVGWDKLELTDDDVFLPIAGMELDFGGVVKEYAADALVNCARSHGIDRGLVNLGGDIAIIGPQPDDEPWSIGIVHPTIEDTAIATIELQDGAITTSGGYERYFEIDGTRYSHLINPKTGFPVESLLSASVTAPQAVVAGSMTSIALLKNESEGIDWLDSCEVPFLAVDQQLNCHGHLSEVAYA